MKSNGPTVPTHINLRRFIKIWGFQGGGLLKILPIKASKSLKKWTFGPKKWRFIQILLYWWFNQEWRFICVDTVFQKSRKFWSISLVYFINHTPLISEEWHIHINTSLFKRLNFYLQKKLFIAIFCTSYDKWQHILKGPFFEEELSKQLYIFLSGCTYKQMLRFFIRKMVLNSTFLFL